MRAFYGAWKLLPPVRAMLLKQFPPQHGDVRCDHVTYGYWEGFPAPDHKVVAPPFTVMEVYSHLVNPVRQVLGVSLDGERFRSDGVPYHITLSHAANIKSGDSGETLARYLRGTNHPYISPVRPALPIFVGEPYMKEVR